MLGLQIFLSPLGVKVAVDRTDDRRQAGIHGGFHHRASSTPTQSPRPRSRSGARDFFQKEAEQRLSSSAVSSLSSAPPFLLSRAHLGRAANTKSQLDSRGQVPRGKGKELLSHRCDVSLPPNWGGKGCGGGRSWESRPETGTELSCQLE